MNKLTLQVKVYISCLVILAVFILIHALTVTELTWSVFKAIVFFIVISSIAESLTIKLPKGGTFSVNFAIDLACIMLFGPDITIWVVLGSELFKKDNLTGKTPLSKVFFNSAQFVVSVWLAGNTYIFLGGTVDSNPISILLPFIGATLVYSFINISAVTIVLALVQKSSPWGIWLMNFRWVAPNFLAFAPLSLLMANVYKVTGILGVFLFFVPLLLARYVFKSYMEVREVYLNTLEALASSLDAKDKYTKGHSDRVAKYAVEISRELKLPEDQIELIEQMALLHDIGKIGVSEELLNRLTKLSDDEFDLIKMHSITGANILKNIHNLDVGVKYVRHHHEKFDGSGYPDSLSGDEIPLGARIITVADSFDAMTSDRPYRKGMTVENALLEVRKCAGTHFDKDVVEAFLTIWETGKISSTVQPFESSISSLT